jgi:porin
MIKLKKECIRSGPAMVFGLLATLAAESASAADTSQSPVILKDATQRTETLQELDQRLGLKGWNIPFFSFAGSLGQDIGGWRSNLAKYGIGFLIYDLGSFSANSLDVAHKDPSGNQRYWGQTPSFYNTGNIVITYDLSQYGVPDGQINFLYNFTNSTWNHYTPTRDGKLYRLAYYQSLFDRKVELSFGYMTNSTTFVGIYVGGQISNPLGPSSTIPAELGLATSVAIAPTFWIKNNLTENLYNQFGVQRSISPTASAVYDDSLINPTGFNFDFPGAKALYIDEIGYKQNAATDRPYTWLRAGAIYNTSLYRNYKTGGQSDNAGFYALADRQIWQMDPSRPRRGIYTGVSAMYAKPETNIITQYYEARVYAFGLFDARPNDMLSLVYQHNVISSYWADPINNTAPRTSSYARHAVNTITASYQVYLRPGLTFTGGMGYTDHPSTTHFRGEGSALNFLGGFSFVF